MYYCKIAQTEVEFQAIARLNYQTFVEEIPQHPANEQQSLVDAFHEQNTYIICYHHQDIVGMLAFRDQRPFSLDKKIGTIENHLSAEQCRKLCELRLLAMEPAYRHTLAFFRLIQAMYRYVLDHDYSACVISGTTRQAKLYHKIGFRAFAPEVGNENARFVPMVLLPESAHELFQRLPHTQTKRVFYPGPVEQKNELSHTQLSHRSASFEHLHQKVTHQLTQLSQSKHVALFLGSGTLANAVMLQQVWQRHQTARGLVCINGEFGQRLANQAQALGLQFDIHEQAWGQKLDTNLLATQLPQAAWVAWVHGETSTACLNELDFFVQSKKQHGHTLAVDCVSSFGALPFSLQDVDFASATSGKAIGALAGLSWLFYQEAPAQSPLPHHVYTDLYHYHQQTPFTLPAYLLKNAFDALSHYPKRYDLLQQRLEQVLNSPSLKGVLLKSPQAYPCTINLHWSTSLSKNAVLNGLHLHDQSAYLKQHAWAQISVIQPNFEEDLAALTDWFTHLKTTETVAAH